MTFADLLVVAVFLLPLPLNWYVAWRLWRLSQGARDILALQERALVALALALIVLVFALIFVNNGLEMPLMDVEATRIVTRAAIVALCLPALYWLWIYRKR